MPRRRGRPILLALGLLAATAAVAGGQDDIAPHRECGYCGMDRKAYAYSRMLVRYQDGAEVGVCSLHCATLELDAHPGKAVQSMQVADRDSRELIEAETASWVLGGRKRGVMTPRAKWAFATPGSAEAFVREQGGEIVPWSAALAAAREDAARAEQEERARVARGTFGCAGTSAASHP